MVDRVSPVITDAVTQVNVKVLGDASAMSLSNLYLAISQSLSLAAQNAVTAQQQANIIHQATTTQGVSLIYSINTLSMGTAGAKTTSSDTAEMLVNLVTLIKVLQDLIRQKEIQQSRGVYP
jgi:hypothetical protein